MCYKDKTFCASPNCKNECGRKMTEDEKITLQKNWAPVNYGYFCGDKAACPNCKEMVSIFETCFCNLP
jgi:hypothetical protein